MIYFPVATAYLWRRGGGFRMTGLSADESYRAFFWDPTNPVEYPPGPVTVESDGSWTIPHPPIFQDWVLVLEASKH